MARFHGRLREIPNVLNGFGRKKALAEEAGLSALQTKAIVRKTLDAIVSTLITDLRSDAAIRGFRDQDTGVPRRATREPARRISSQKTSWWRLKQATRWKSAYNRLLRIWPEQTMPREPVEPEFSQ